MITRRTLFGLIPAAAVAGFGGLWRCLEDGPQNEAVVGLDFGRFTTVVFTRKYARGYALDEIMATKLESEVDFK